MTKDQIKKARTLLAKAHIGEDNKIVIVESFTDGRTGSLSAMDYPETMALFKYLEDMTGQPPSQSDKSKRKILSLAHEMKWHVAGTRRVDMNRVNNFFISKLKHPLDDLNVGDLNKAVTMFSKVHVGYLNGI
jgi:hypothetical protein